MTPTTQRPAIVNLMIDTHATSGSSVRPVSIGGLQALNRLREAMQSDGYDWLTPSEARAAAPGRALTVLWDFGSVTRLPYWLVRRRPAGVVAWSLESPLVAHRAYHRLAKIGREAEFVFVFPGAESLTRAPSTTHPLHWPNDPRPISAGRPAADRELLVLINSNKRARPGLEMLDRRRPYRSVRVLAASCLAASYGPRGSWTVPDLYEERLRAVMALAPSGGLAVHGMGWDTGPWPGWVDPTLIAHAYRGPVVDKDVTLQGFRFALVIENTSFAGYISEKLFDCLHNGTVPVYLGAPDVAEYVPQETFVDAREFSTYSELEAHLRGLPIRRVLEYQAAARDYLQSPDFERFTANHFVEQLGLALEHVVALRRSGPCAG